MRAFVLRIAAALSVVLPLVCAAQSPPVHWTRSLDPGTGNTWLMGAGEFYSDQRAAAADAAGNLFVASSRFDGSTFIWVTTKFDAATGATLWQKTYSEVGAGPHYARGLAVDAAGNVVVTGEVEIADVSHVKTIKYAGADGAIVWHKGPETGRAGKAVAIDAAGNAIVTGGNLFTGDITTTKHAAADGAILWEKTFDGATGSVPAAIALDATGNAIVAGTSYGTDENFLVIKYASADGAIAWQETFDSGTGSDYATSLAIDAAGNAIVAGVSSNVLDNNFRTIKFAASDGAILWNRTFDGGFQDEAISVAVDGSGNAAVGGYAYDPLDLDRDLKVLVYAAADGATLHEITFNGFGDVDDIAQAVAFDAGGSIIAVGASSSNIIARKYSGSTGALVWAYTHAGLGWSARGVVAVPTSSALYVAGNVDDGTTTFLRVARVGLTIPSAAPHSGFNGDARSDVFWRDVTGGLNYQWQMNGLALSGQGYMPSVPSNWAVAGIGDVNGNGIADVFWREAGGLNYLWMMNGLGIASQGYLPTVANPWMVVGLGDANGDGRADVFWRNPTSGQNYLWVMNGLSISSQGYMPSVAGPDWEAVGVADYSGDGKADVFWRNKTTGQNYLWVMNGLVVSSQGFLTTIASTDWEVVGSPDANGDGKADALWRNKVTGQNYLWVMNGLAIASQGYLPSVNDTNWKVVGYGDYDGDGKGDVLWRNAASGLNYLWRLNGISVATQGYLPSVTGANWQPVKR